MKKILEYRIVVENSQKRLEIAVNEAIQKGWQPLGGIDAVGLDWLQAIVMYGDE